MDRKPEMVVALSPRLASEAPVQDLGHVPGDGLGAAGRQFPKEVTCVCRVELQERERLVYILGLCKVKTLSDPSAAARTG